jgi:hypothetical protein
MRDDVIRADVLNPRECVMFGIPLRSEVDVTPASWGSLRLAVLDSTVLIEAAGCAVGHVEVRIDRNVQAVFLQAYPSAATAERL